MIFVMFAVKSSAKGNRRRRVSGLQMRTETRDKAGSDCIVQLYGGVVMVSIMTGLPLFPRCPVNINYIN